MTRRHQGSEIRPARRRGPALVVTSPGCSPISGIGFPPLRNQWSRLRNPGCSITHPRKGSGAATTDGHQPKPLYRRGG